jgi:hypothetical protein
MPTSAPLYQNIISTLPSNLRQCTPADFNNNITTVNCSSNLAPSNIPSTNGFSKSIIVFNNGADDFQHLSHGVSQSTLIIYSGSNNPTTIGKFNPNGFINSQIVVVGNANLDDKIMKPVGSSIYITGNANLTNFSLQNPDSLTKICVDGTITPASMANIAGVYSKQSNYSAYQANCMGSSNTGGNNSLTINGSTISSILENKSVVTY